jgi:hypothetical protein
VPPFVNLSVNFERCSLPGAQNLPGQCGSIKADQASVNTERLIANAFRSLNHNLNDIWEL